MRISYLSVIFAASLLLGACAPSAVVGLQNTFQGYPCGDNCDRFRQGFEMARDKQYTHNEQCQTAEPGLQLGCQSFVHEYKIENDLPPYYQFVNQ